MRVELAMSGITYIRDSNFAVICPLNESNPNNHADT